MGRTLLMSSQQMARGSSTRLVPAKAWRLVRASHAGRAFAKGFRRF